MDIVFCACGQSETDSNRLDHLFDSTVDIGRLVILASNDVSLDGLLARASGSKVPWVSLAGEWSPSGINRALALTTADVLLIPPQYLLSRTSPEELARVFQDEDRVALVSPAPCASSEVMDGELVNWISHQESASGCQIEVPVGECVLLRGDVLAMVGCLDERFLRVWEALADWACRARRLGFTLAQAGRALAYNSLGEDARPVADLEASWPDVRWLLQRQSQATEVSNFRRVQNVRKKALRVCIDGRHLPVDAVNGTGVYAVELAKALSRWTSARVTWWVAHEAQKALLAPLDMPVYLPGQALPVVDVVHRPAQVFGAWELSALLKLDAPLVISYQDLISYRIPFLHGTAMHHETYQLVSRLAVQSCQQVIAISEHNRKEIIREFNVEPEAVRVVYHGVDHDRFSGPSAARNSELLRDLSIYGRFFLVVGSDYYHKNVRIVAAAYARFRAQWTGREPPPSLVIVGHGSGVKDGLFARLKVQGQDGVRFLGNVPNEAVSALYRECIAFLYVSAYEGFGLPVLEAMAAGAPVIASTFSSIPEVGGDAAHYLDRVDDSSVLQAMQLLASREDVRAELRQRGLVRCRAFQWESAANGTYETYERAVWQPSAGSYRERRHAVVVSERLFG